LHEKKIFHSDLKPANVLVSKDFVHVKLVDFGLSLISSSHNNSQNKQGGTFHYMSPEQALGEPSSFKSDIYSFGCLLHTLCLYDKPWKELNFTQILLKFSNNDTIVVEDKDIPDYFKDIIRDCLKFDPDQRPSSAILYSKFKRLYEKRFDELFYKDESSDLIN